MLTCDHCDKEFKFQSEKKRHELSHFTIHECEVCEKTFSFVSSLRRHQRQHKRKGSVQCQKCNHYFKDEILLQRHIQYAHKGSFPCPDCKAVYHSELALKAHSKCHRTDSQKKYVCSYFGCGKKFNYAHHLHHHELAHTGSKQHYCNVCGKGFIQLHHLKSHLKLHEPSDWLLCPIGNCKKEFPTQYAMKRHLKKHETKQKENSMCDSTAEEHVVQRDNDAGRIYSKIVADEAIYDEIPKKELESKVTKQYDDDTAITKSDIQESVNACTSIIGGCLVSGSNEVSKDCLCARMDLEENVTVDNTYRNNAETKSIQNRNENMSDVCCDDKKQSANNNKLIRIDVQDKNDMPKIEYGSDGTVKLKETFDIDIEYNEVADDRCIFKESSNEPFLLNSCKAVLGKCIVSGNGLIGEGCLCARMAMDDPLIAEQEVDEITPCPSGVSMNHVI